MTNTGDCDTDWGRKKQVLPLLIVIKHGERYKEPGEDYLVQRNNVNKLVKIRREARALGYDLVEIAAE